MSIFRRRLDVADDDDEDGGVEAGGEKAEGEASNAAS